MRDFSAVKTIVVKVGTNLLSSPSGIDEGKIDDIAAQICALRSLGYNVLLVSSGAVGMGAKELGRKEAVKAISLRQACASIGQPMLMSSYRASFKKRGALCSQVLLTRADFNNRKTSVNLLNSVNELLSLGVIPVFNENDVTSIAEIGTAFGDNDRMSALVASHFNANLLVILTDVEGIYTGDPKKEGSGATLLSEIDKIDSKVASYAGGKGSVFSTGGMKTKIAAAEIASQAGCITVIASGYTEKALLRIITGEALGTYVHPQKRLSSRSRWILNNTHAGSITVDDGAIRALHNNKSLLPSGVKGVSGSFDEGDVVCILSEDGKAVAKAVPYLSSLEIEKLMGRKLSDAADVLGVGKKAIIFRPEDMVFLEDSGAEE